jgi:hypothetical protein
MDKTRMQTNGEKPILTEEFQPDKNLDRPKNVYECDPKLSLVLLADVIPKNREKSGSLLDPVNELYQLPPDKPKTQWVDPLDSSDPKGLCHGANSNPNAIWNLTEACGELYLGAWTAKKYAPSVAEAAAAKTMMRGAEKTRCIGRAYGSTVAATALGLGFDQLVWAKEQKLEATTVADWLVVPAISVCPVRLPLRVGMQAGAHILGRLIDHLHQPFKSF